MNNSKSIKAIGLLSGGLDSTLAVKLMLDQGIDVTVLNFVTPFCTCTRKGCKHEASRVAELFGIPVKIISGGQEYIEMIKMEDIGASFIFTGEVLGQRPMSQHKKAMKTIEQESGLENLIVRPLSAKLLDSTIPEDENWIDREKLLSIQGRRRLPQMELADQLGIKDYPCPAGGCRLTDPQFAIENGAKVVVGRDEEENKILQGFFEKDDILIEVIGVGSPIVILKKSKNKGDIKKAASLCVRYSDIVDTKKAEVRIKYSDDHEELTTLPMI
jgi:tRNA U34 2-thiouridine synthase MnmA/TrmU